MNHSYRTALVRAGIAVFGCLWLASALATAQTPRSSDAAMTLKGFFVCPVVEGANDPCAFEMHYVDLRAGTTYAIRLNSPRVATRLSLEDLRGKVLGVDTEFVDELDGWIVYRAEATGRYRLIAEALHAIPNSNEGHYTITVCELPEMMRVRDDLPSSDFGRLTEIRMEAGRHYVIDMQTRAFEPLVKLLNAEGAIVAFNDEGWLGRPARIVFVAPRTGMYRIEAAVAGPHGAGEFMVTVCEK